MPLATKTIHGQHFAADGGYDSGTVTYTSDHYTQIPIDNSTVSPLVFSATFGPESLGEYTILDVPVCNDPDGLPNPFSYIEQIVFLDGRVRVRTVFIDIDAPATVEMADLPESQPIDITTNYATLDGSGNVPLSQLGNLPTSSSGSYVHSQNSPASTWIVNHNLNSYVGVTAYSASGEFIIPDVNWVSINTINLIFPSPTTGKVVCS